MATGSATVSITVPNLNGAGGPGLVGNASNELTVSLLQQVVQANGASGKTSGNIIYPPGSGAVVGTWTYTAAS